jgi:hypothetical protein
MYKQILVPIDGSETCFEIGSPAKYLTGDSYGQSKEACRDTQESLETREGKRQTCAQEGGKARNHEKAATEDHSKNDTKKSAKTGGAGNRRHDHRRDR